MSHSQTDVRYREAASPEEPRARWNGFLPGQSVLRSGTQLSPENCPLTCDIQVVRDHAITLRDGTVVYVDIYRPISSEPVPAILALGVYGKQGGFFHPGTYPGNSGIAPGVVSGLQKFEGPDPAFWCAHGYAVVNIDGRGAFESGGDIQLFGPQEAEDNYDIIEAIAGENWCSGKIGLSGNGWLALAQWFVAALQPPHLAAIAPWESFADSYRDLVCRGGIISQEFIETIVACLFGRNGVEDLPAMVGLHPFYDAYWESKTVNPGAIQVPAYVVSSYTTTLHVRGGPASFNQLDPDRSWLRLHNTHEWPDLYEYQDDLLKFFDATLKGLKNDWHETPRVRIAVLDPGHEDTVNRAEASWPPADMKPVRFCLDAASGVLAEQAGDAATISYDAASGRVTFNYKATEEFELVGPSKLRLWVEAEGADDLDLYAFIQKLDADGTPLLSQSLPGVWVPVATGQLRASHRELDASLSTPLEPVHAHQREQRLVPGEIVDVEIGLWPAAMRFHPGETMQLVIAGHDSRVRYLNQDATANRNTGSHRIHTGPQYDSHLLLPIVSRRDA